MDNDDYTAKMTELIALLRVIGNDTQQCEVKECKRRISSTITETLSAFSNGNGGYIILGLSEKAGFTPVEGFDARAMQEALSQACEKLTPVVRPVIVTSPFEGANLVFAVIDEMLPREKPCFVELVKLFVFGVCFINRVPFVRGMRPRVGRGPVSSWSLCAPR